MYQTYSFAEAIKRKILRYGVPQRGEAPLIYSNHILSYDRSKRTPVWVAERITHYQTQGKDSSLLSLSLSLSLEIFVCLSSLSLSLSLSASRSVYASLLSLSFSPSLSLSQSVSASLLSFSLSLSRDLCLPLFSLS